MAQLKFTPNLQRHVDCPELEASGKSVAEVLEVAFEIQPSLRGYVVDEHGKLRKHMVVFVDGKPAKDREQLTDAVQDDSEVFVMQALSGG